MGIFNGQRESNNNSNYLNKQFLTIMSLWKQNYEKYADDRLIIQ